MPESRKKKAIPFAPCHLVIIGAEMPLGGVFTGLAGHSRGNDGLRDLRGSGEGSNFPVG